MTSLGRSTSFYQTLTLAFLGACLLLVPFTQAQDDDDPPPPPEPSKTSLIGQEVTNPQTNQVTIVTALIKDPAGTPSAGTTAFVRTSDGYVFLVKDAGEMIYNADTPPEGYLILSKDPTTHTATIRSSDEEATETALFSYQIPYTTFQEQFYGEDEEGEQPAPVDTVGADGVRKVLTGKTGSKGRNGALFVSPRSGGDGARGPNVDYTNLQNITTSTKIGIEIGSVGGNGGKGGNSYFSYHRGRSGGDGGAGGTVSLINGEGIRIQTTGKDHHGIFAYSRSGKAGDGGSGYVATGGGSGGHSNDGGDVTVTNRGLIQTNGESANGIYALSVSNNGGRGGDSWGLVGKAGNGSYGGNGGQVQVTNTSTGQILTLGIFSHGILAQSIGGTGGSSGTSGGLVALNGEADDGGNGGQVDVLNAGQITTRGNDSRGIFAQSIGGGGGSGGSSYGLVALGGAGSYGGHAGAVQVINQSTGSIHTEGARADGIFAQSVGGSGGSGSNSGGLVSVGGSGSRGGNGSTVRVENYGSITTEGFRARGIVAQSIGGGGGDGGNSGGLVSVGGNGSGGGASGLVHVRHGGTIETLGNEASGIIAQSIGGGGGNGGSSGSISVFAGVSVGGAGSTGGNGGEVRVSLQGVDEDSASLIRTQGNRAVGIFAQSIGGGGGNGGGALSVTGGYGVAASVAVGGKGGAGGDGGLVTLESGANLSIIDTAGQDSAGVLLQSVGGGGGNGGYAISVAVAAGESVAGALALAIGGDGGAGGDGGRVQAGRFLADGSIEELGYKGSIQTQGDRSIGFLAQSVGGGGGNGGLAVSGSMSASAGLAASISLGLGGDGAGGGSGDRVEVALQGNITTRGDHSTGMLAQSVGGGGGNGGGSIAASVGLSGGGAGSVNLAMGGNAALGGHGGDVHVATGEGTVTTQGENSVGILIQSVGGGGGNGGYSIAAGGAAASVGGGAVNVGVGGLGGAGGHGGDVIADLQSNVITSSLWITDKEDELTGELLPGHYASHSTGILVQSVGGGGGNGGFSIAAGAALAGDGSGAISLGLGGRGGNGGTGGDVRVTSSGTISTRGDQSAGIVAQSIGGGGGNGGYTVSVSGAGSGGISGAIALGLGGNGGAGNHAGSVFLHTHTGSVDTRGADAVGILAQSVGGGGGNGGYNVSVAASGASGGSGAITLGLGGSGGSGGHADEVELIVENDVRTEGENSAGVVAQSIGGGGGNGGYNVAASGSGGSSGSGAISVGLGGAGGSAGNGARVSSSVLGQIETFGDDSVGFLSQSVGGGGGNGAYNVSLSGSGGGSGSGAISVGLGGNGAGGGDGSLVEARHQGLIRTHGEQSAGFLAQSVGGGGGNGGFSISTALSVSGSGSGAIALGFGGRGSGGGHGGQVLADVEGAIWTTRDRSAALVAQSIGGGGGNGGFNVSVTGVAASSGAGAGSVGLGGEGALGGHGGTVDLHMEGAILTEGNDSIGILAQSVGGGGGNGGFSITAPLSGSGTGAGAVGVGIGGSGGGGGNGGRVTAELAAQVVTEGQNSGGVLVQSVGGGGGNGGFSITGALAYGSTNSGALAIGLGGTGGQGGQGGGVDSHFVGKVFTGGADSAGVAAQSLGGGGGNGGLNVSGTIGLAGENSVSASIGVGGFGGAGGDADEVLHRLEGYVETLGAGSAGFLTQSIGGGGGNGGINVSGAISASTSSGNLSFGLGGFGGGGGNGASVESELIGGVFTSGDRSPAVLTQSVGGGGGNGGLNVSGNVNLSKQGGGAVGLGIGGFGGGGGRAGDVVSTVRPSADHRTIATVGDESSGVVAQSLGGGGGYGGLNVSGAVNYSGESGGGLAFGLGGFGGDGGDAGHVSLDVVATIVTMGNHSHGLLAQSVGGGGGNGGLNVSGALTITSSNAGNNTTVASAIGIGGFGGKGGDSGDVEVRFEGRIQAQPGIYTPPSQDPDTGEDLPASFVPTDGKGSHGLVAQSIAGGGGNGGINVSGGISYARGEGNGHGLIFGFGGYGGEGGDAGEVDVEIIGGESISAYGKGHSAILAQSIGGGGGNGGINVTGDISSDAPVLVGVGGQGGQAGRARKVEVRSHAQLYVHSEKSDENTVAAGLLAQSIGGGGGNGGLNVSGGLAIDKQSNHPSLTLGIGGDGGAAASSGLVDVNHLGDIVTEGDRIHGILAQSLAGGGGNGGMNVSGQINWADAESSGGSKDLSLVVGVGGSGGTGADAGDVHVVHHGIISTTGDKSRGLFAQSIGGGGGEGAINVTALFARKSSPINVGVGGSGNNAGNAGDVSVRRGSAGTATGWIATDGIGAHAIEASSIGGGGGDAGLNINAAYSRVGAADTEPGFAANFTVGGGGGQAGHAGNTSVHNYSDLYTQKDRSHGILAQSIGGGGGNASFNIAVALTSSGSSQGSPFEAGQEPMEYSQPNRNMGFSLAIGGVTGDGGEAGEVEVIHQGDIETRGHESVGILAQSIGGGGGNAGLDIAYIKADGGKAGITIGREGGTGGSGGRVELRSKGFIETHGNRSHGLQAQSVGNGGGNSSTTKVSAEAPSAEAPNGDVRPEAVTVAVGIQGGQGGHGGDVELVAEGFIATHGESSHAVFAQSIGGGGGTGGSGNTFGITAARIGIALGAEGGEGGYGGAVDVFSSAQLRTEGEGSIGILAQSVGGGGGNGGFALGGGLKSGDTGLSIAIGGQGGKGMTGGRVQAVNEGVIITSGVDAHGILAQSLGGGGGNGAMATNLIMKHSVDSATRIDVTLGGNGGEGARGGDVEVRNTGGIGTGEDNSIGIFAQSIGGGGGNASKVLSSQELGSSGNHISATVGGNGGDGAEGGTVIVRNETTADPNSGKILTLGNGSHGILAMSVGGGGGNGSTTMRTMASRSKTGSSSGSYSLTLGGNGGDGGRGGRVEVENDGLIQTYGARAHGIVAQSIGGGGGNGGMSLAGDFVLGSKTAPATGRIGMFALGGQGGDGNRSDLVTVTNRGTIEVFGPQSYGIFAQSIGGGGGDGGLAMAISRNLLKNPGTDLLPSLSTLALGGFGGDGADSGDVLVEHSGSITVHGDRAYGIFAQSVSGGGGNANYSLSAPVWTVADFAMKQFIGGGSTGDAGRVDIQTTGDITMLGANSVALFGQSVNGGGGNVENFLDLSQQAAALGDNGEIMPNPGGDFDKAKGYIQWGVQLGGEYLSIAAGAVSDFAHLGDIQAAGKGAVGSLFQSVGGGGGRSTQEIWLDTESHIDLELELGGTSNVDGSGGDITGRREGDVFASGWQSRGLSIQSIGGGGGDLIVELRRPGSARPAVTVHFPTLPKAGGGASTTTLLVGADGGAANNGGNVDLDFSGDLVADSSHAPAMIIQSIGGGGGQSLLSGIEELLVNIGGRNGASGHGGHIRIHNVGHILSTGTLAPGVVLQSIGGGGGAVFTDLDPRLIQVNANQDNQGDGGDIEFRQEGDLAARGRRSTGIILQSLGGGGGLVDDRFLGAAGGSGRSGGIRFELAGNLFADGKGGVGIFAQSRGSQGQGNIEIDLLGGNALVFGRGGTGIHFSGGAANHLTNQQHIIGVDGLEGWAIRGEEGSEHIDNYGIVVGQIQLGGGQNAVTNHRHALWLAGPQMRLGAADNRFENRGEFHPGGSGLAQRTRMTGSFTQGRGAITFADLDFRSGVLDGVDLSGRASLRGRVVLNLLNPQLVPTGAHRQVLFSAAKGITARQLQLVTLPSVVISYDLIYPNRREAVLAYEVDFAPKDGHLGVNLREVGQYLNRLQAVGSSEALADLVTQLLYTGNFEDYRTLLSQLGPDFYGELQAEMLRSNQRFAESLLGRRGYRFRQGGRALWFDYDSADTEHRRHDDYKRVLHRSNEVAMGYEFEWEEWTTGFGLAHAEHSSWGYEGQWQGRGDSDRLGWVLRYRKEDTEISGTVSYGWNDTQVSRTGVLATPFLTGTERDLTALTALLRVSHEITSGGFYLIPALDLGATRLNAESAREQGAGATDLHLRDTVESHSWIRPGLELGREFELSGHARMRLHAEAGYLHYLDGGVTHAVAGFQGAPAGVTPMEVPIELGEMATYGFGGTLLLGDDVRISVIYTRAEADDYHFDAINFRFSTSF